MLCQVSLAYAFGVIDSLQQNYWIEKPFIKQGISGSQNAFYNITATAACQKEVLCSPLILKPLACHRILPASFLTVQKLIIYNFRHNWKVNWFSSNFTCFPLTMIFLVLPFFYSWLSVMTGTWYAFLFVYPCCQSKSKARCISQLSLCLQMPRHSFFLSRFDLTPRLQSTGFCWAYDMGNGEGTKGKVEGREAEY